MTVYFSGYVFQDDGDALSGATVELVQVSDGVTEVSTTTDSNGLWAFNEADDDRYDVKITKGSSVRYRKWADEISLKTLDVRNNEGNTVGAASFTNLTNHISNQVATFSGANSTRADGDEIYLSFKLANSAGDIEEFARITAEAVDVTDGAEDGQLRFGVAKTDGTITDVFTINSTTGGETSMTLDVSGDLTLDADGGDVFFKDGGTTFGSATNNSGNLIIKSGTTTAATFTGANVLFAGTVDATTDFTIGDTVITDGVITDSTGLQLAANLDINGTADISGDVTLSGGADGALQFTNAGENSIKIPNNQASALIIEEANNAYITFVTTDSSEAITVAKATTFSAGIANAGTIAAGTWNGTAIASSYIAADAITGAKIADDAIDSEHYTDGSIDTAHLAADAVTGAKIADNAIDSEHYTDGSIDNAHLADDAVGADELAANAVVNASVASGAAIDVSKLALTAGDGLTLNTNDMDLDAALTTVTSVYNASLKLGRDADNLVDFATTDNKIIFRVEGVNEVELVQNALSPVTSNGVALGTSSLGYSSLDIHDGGYIRFGTAYPIIDDNGYLQITNTKDADFWWSHYGDFGSGDEARNVMQLDTSLYQLSIGKGNVADPAFILDGNGADYHIGLLDNTDLLYIGKGLTIGSSPGIVVGNQARVGIGVIPSDTINLRNVQNNAVIDDNSARYGQVNNLFWHKTSAAFTSVAYSGYFVANVDTTNTQNWTQAVGLRGIYAKANVTTQASGTATITGMAGAYIASNTTDNATVTNNYGLYVENQTAGTNDYGVWIAGGATTALTVASGISRFGDGQIETDSDATNPGMIQIYDRPTAVTGGSGLEFKSSTYENGYGWMVTNPDLSGTTPLIFASRANNAAWTEIIRLEHSGDLTLKGTTPSITIGDAGAEDTKVVFDGASVDYYVGLENAENQLTIGKGSTLGTTQAITVGSTPTVGLFRDAGANNLISVRPGGATLTAADAEGSAFYVEVATQNFNNASSTLSKQAALSVRAQTYTGDNATLTLTEAAAIYAEVPVAGTNVGIGTAYSILATGVIKCTSVTQTSDIAFKENIQTIDNATDVVKKLRPVTFDWKEDKKSAAGFIAQDVEELFPYIVDGESGNKSVRYTAILAQVTKALQESIEKIETLEKQVKELGG